MCSQKHYLSASDARKMTNDIITHNVNDDMSMIMSLIKEAIALERDYVSISYDRFNHTIQNLRDLEYKVSITFDDQWINIRW